MALLPPGLDPELVDIWFQDETRVGQQGGITRMWAEKGTRPRVVRQQQFTYTYIYGAVCPEQGSAVGLIIPCVNTAAMKLHVEAISEQVPAGRHALVISDGAAWHSEKVNCHNVTLLKLPPYSPELNPVEQIWQWLKQKMLSNRTYKNYKAIEDACCEAWNRFVEDAERITGMCSREWATIKES